ncbi:MAG: formate dehydrogenase accessory sulfurtransferase FdhD [Sulfobacillus thermosulfidooxidans]|nr:MAG: formate dehydrogenase accessory sulfurtransferase FdhD [Sulfobacillus thermosulfidooxidans]
MEVPKRLQDAVRMLTRDHYDQGEWRRESAEIVREEAFTLFINGREWTTMIVTPTDLYELVVGFLAAEHFIVAPQEISICQIRESEGQVWVRIPGLRPELLAQSGKRYISNCCGRGRTGFYFAEDADIRPVPQGALRLKAHILGTLFNEFSAWTQMQHSGGLHAAGLWREGRLVAIRADVGRHNALDKLYGYSLLHALSLGEAAVVFSGRLSSEVIIKIARMGVPAVISNAAPTTLGIALAEALGITAVGFVRDEELSVYSHPERIDAPSL